MTARRPRDVDLALGDDVEAVAGVALADDTVPGIDAERDEPGGEMLERPPGSGAKIGIEASSGAVGAGAGAAASIRARFAPEQRRRGPAASARRR